MLYIPGMTMVMATPISRAHIHCIFSGIQTQRRLGQTQRSRMFVHWLNSRHEAVDRRSGYLRADGHSGNALICHCTGKKTIQILTCTALPNKICFIVFPESELNLISFIGLMWFRVAKDSFVELSRTIACSALVTTIPSTKWNSVPSTKLEIKSTGNMKPMALLLTQRELNWNKTPCLSWQTVLWHKTKDQWNLTLFCSANFSGHLPMKSTATTLQLYEVMANCQDPWASHSSIYACIL